MAKGWTDSSWPGRSSSEINCERAWISRPPTKRHRNESEVYRRLTPDQTLTLSARRETNQTSEHEDGLRLAKEEAERCCKLQKLQLRNIRQLPPLESIGVDLACS